METSLSKVLKWVASGMLPPAPRSEIHSVLGNPMRKILVTGASGRLGQALLAQPGFDFIPISGVDLSNFENTAAVISGCGTFDGIVTLAGGWAPDDQQDDEEMMSKNFLTALNAVGASIDILKASSHPRIVMIGAASALTDQTTAYNRAKNAVHNLAKMLAKELPPKFKTNVIAPSTIRDYDYVAKQIVKLLQVNTTTTGEIFIV